MEKKTLSIPQKNILCISEANGWMENSIQFCKNVPSCSVGKAADASLKAEEILQECQ